MIAGISSATRNIRATIDKLLHPRIFWILLLVAVAVPAVLSVFGQGLRPAILWFPGIHGKKNEAPRAVAEIRYVTADGDTLSDAVRILDELFLGPIIAQHESLTLPGSYVLAALFRKNVLYVDLSTDILFGRLMPSGVYQFPPYPPATVLDLTVRTLAWNFPGKRIVITIGGYEPSWKVLAKSK